MSAYEGRLVATPGPLRSSVARVRVLDRLPPAREQLLLRHLPSGASSLTVVSPPAGGALQVFVAGPVTAAKYKWIVPSPSFVHLALEPCVARAVLGVPLHELADRVVTIEDLWGRAGRELLDALAPVEGRSRELVAMLGSRVVRRLDRAKPAADAELVRRAARALLRGGRSAGILGLAERLGVGERALRHAFREHVGVSPKRYARIARIRRVLRRAGAAGWADLALEQGFYDQAHLNAEFRALLRVSPRDYLAGRLPVTASP